MSEEQPSDPKPRRGCCWLCLPVALGVVAAVWWLLTPSYIKLSIPVDEHPAVGYFWWQTQTSRLRYADDLGTLNLYRQVGTGYADTHGWATPEEAISHFGDWLLEHGWEERRSSFNEGDPIAPETRFLRHLEEYRVYVRSDDTRGGSPRVVVAVEPLPKVSGYKVSIVTAKASPLRRLADALDD